MDYLTNYYKNLSEQLQEKVAILNKRLMETSGYAGDDQISREVARERRKMTPEQKKAEMAMQLERINASRIKSGQKPFTSMEEYVEHARKENEAFALARQRQTKERIETWANTPEGQAHIAAHTPTPNVTPQQY